ncbi:MAG: DNA translocase FtsK [Eubacterium sp.]|nr:DNA translocase FtsK [Eubacterium sp.]
MALCLLLFLSMIGVCGAVGKGISSVLFGLFGLPAWAFPFLLGYLFLFILANAGSRGTASRVVGLIGLYITCCALFQLIQYGYEPGSGLDTIYRECGAERAGGGVVGGFFVILFGGALGTIGAYVIILIALVVFVILLTQKPLLSALRNQGESAYDSAKERRLARNEANLQRSSERRLRKETERALKERQREVQAERERNVAAVRRRSANIPQMVVPQNLKEEARMREESRRIRNITPNTEAVPFTVQDDVIINSAVPSGMNEYFTTIKREDTPFDSREDNAGKTEFPVPTPPEKTGIPEEVTVFKEKKPKKTGAAAGKGTDVQQMIYVQQETDQEYIFPPVSMLKRAAGNKKGESNEHLKAMAFKLQETLHSFGVEVTINHISCGPTVTRYELTPQQGVKVSRIVSLADDIKLNLAAADIRIEAPIPGKAAIGIEVPNKTNQQVMLRELLESQAFQRQNSHLAFAVGKDIAGQPVVTDIAKMPHLLIAGATGSGKSVCINTLIMSILYKSAPEEVRFIMIDPKVVELSVYNGIPHLLIPVVTDPKKAAGALNWAVAEMTDRYRKFADMGARDISGYNARIENLPEPEEGERPGKMPQIVIIVDELADLMMAAQNEVEDAICRLAQLARAAGIHLIIATQRPSVNVITGLIKANMPSRIALAVTSGVDSRTILDMNGAEKLLGKGDMLFYPQGYPKPARVQGAYVSDDEILNVVRFLLDHHAEQKYDEDMQKKIDRAAVSDTVSGSTPDLQAQDEFFTDAGRLIIEKDKASIGMLQRAFRIGFNRAARIMDQLCDAGVVGEEEGTKPRKVLMSMEQFENYLEEN